MRVLLLISFMFLLSPTAHAEGDACPTYPVNVGTVRLDLAPPHDFVEICSQDAALCKVLTQGYPSSSQTVGYFVLPEEWKHFKKHRRQGFSRYLIAQVSRSTAPEEFPDLKAYIRSNNGVIPDHTDLPSALKSQGRVSLGVVDEAADSISFGVIMKLKASAQEDRALALVSLNAAVVVGPQVLSLYVFQDYRSSSDIESAEQLLKSWLQCIRSSNRKSV